MTRRAGTWGRGVAVLFLVIALVFVGLLVHRQWTSLDEVAAGLRGFEWRLRPVWVGSALAVAVLNLLLMGRVWADVFRRTGGMVPRWTGVRIWVVTNFGRYIPGKIWQLGGLAAYMKERGDSGAAALVSAMAFQLVSLVTGVAVAAVTIGLEIAAGSERWVLAAAGGSIVLAAGLHPAALRRAARLLGRWLGEREIEVSLRAKDVATAAAGMLAAWLVYGVAFLCLLIGIGVPIGWSQLPLATGVFAASYVIGYAAIVAPGGLVVREGAMAGLLAELGGVAIGVSAAVAVVARLWLVAAELLALGVVLALPGKSPGQRR